MEGFNKYIKSLEKRIEQLENKEIIIEPLPPMIPISKKVKKVIGYYPNWGTIDNDSILTFNYLSLCFLNFDNFGNAQWNNIDAKRPFHNNTGVSIGGWTYRNKIIKMFNTVNMGDFFDKLFTELIDRGYTYLNIDIEYPPTPDWIENILRTAYSVKNLLYKDIKISVASGVYSKHLAVYKNCSQYIDWIELMAYDCPINEIDGYVISSTKSCLEYGYTRDQIVIGYSFDNRGDNEDTVKNKEDYIEQEELGGIMKWHVGLNNPFDTEPEEKVEIIVIEEDDSPLLWSDNWDNPYRKIVSVRASDPYDKLTTFRGRGHLEIEDGLLKLSGRQPRIYVGVDLQDIEVKCDYIRYGTDGLKWSGFNMGVRSHPEGHSKEPEKAHTYYFRMKHDNHLDFYREIDHGEGGGSGERRILKIIDFNWKAEEWYSMKFRCYNLDNNKIKLEGFVNGELKLEYTDINEKMYQARGVAFLRNTDIGSAGYKNFSIKEIN